LYRQTLALSFATLDNAVVYKAMQLTV